MRFSSDAAKRALVIGVYSNKDGTNSYTPSATTYLDKNPALRDMIPSVTGKKFKLNSHRVLYNQPGYDVLCLCGLGLEKLGEQSVVLLLKTLAQHLLIKNLLLCLVYTSHIMRLSGSFNGCLRRVEFCRCSNNLARQF